MRQRRNGRQLVTSEWHPGSRTEGYDLRRIVPWFFARLEKGPAEERDLADQKLAEDIRAKKLKNDKLEEQLLRRDEVEQAWVELCSLIKEHLGQISDRVAARLPADQAEAVEAIVRDNINDVCRLLAAEAITETD